MTKDKSFIPSAAKLPESCRRHISILMHRLIDRKELNHPSIIALDPLLFQQTYLSNISI